MDNNDSIRGRLRSDLSDKGWWYGAIGGVLSTVIGIALTFGVSAWISNRNDRKEAREMMFNVVKIAVDNGEAVAEYDTLFNSHLKAERDLISIYHRTNGFENLDSLTEDSVSKDMITLWTYKEIPIPHIGTGKYFYSAETMHKFGNANVYAVFSKFVEFDQQTIEEIWALRKMWYDFDRKLNFKLRVTNRKNKVEDVITEMIEDGTLSDYASNIERLNISWHHKWYGYYYKGLLNVMDASEDDFNDYRKSIQLGDGKVHKTHYKAYH